MKNVLITGGAGFIGSHLCEAFLRYNFKVTCIDNLITGKKENIDHLLSNQNFKFIEDNVTNYSFYQQSAISNQQFNLILHFASPAGPNPNSPKSYLKLPIETYLVNSIATHYLLELANKCKAEFLFASTSEVYGNPRQHPQKESYWGNVNPVGPRSCYDESKRFGEMATITYGKKYNLNTKIVRIFNTYGPRMNPLDGRALPLFVSLAIKNKPITIYGTGKQTRSFCYIDDLVNGIILIVNKAKPYSVYNLGNDREIEINKLVDLIKSATNSSSKVVFEPLPKDDPEKRKPDLTKIKNELNWQPLINLEDGLNKTIAWFKKNYAK